MSDHPSYLTDLLDWEALPEAGIELSSEQIERAVQLSQSIPHSTQQWQVYLKALALAGLHEWLEEWAPELTVVDAQSTLFQPESANGMNVVCNLQVGEFTLCLVVTEYQDTVIDLPRAVVDLPSLVPHFYVLVEVLTEQAQVNVYGYLRHDRLEALQQLHSLSATTNSTYALPSAWFNTDPMTLLFDLRCLTPAAIPLPTVTPSQETQPTPEQEVSRPTAIASPINVALWLRDQLDAVAQELAWTLMPAFAPAYALRSVGEALENRGIQIPPEARGAYQDFQVGNIAIRLQVVTWLLPLGADIQGWTLLVVLTAQSGHRLPIGMRLRIQDEAQLLSEQVLTENIPDAALYAQVGGNWDEQFWVTVQSPDGALLTLPTLTFTPD